MSPVCKKIFMKRLKKRVFAVLFCAAVLAGCGGSDPEPRTYFEATFRAELPAGVPPPGGSPAAPGSPVEAMTGDVPGAGADLAWAAPEGWEEQPGSGMRLATFVVEGGECTITSFPGDVGGLQANVERWLGPGQLEIEATAEEAARFIEEAETLSTRGGLTGVFLDFTRFTGVGKGMLTAVLRNEGASVFVKFMGPGDVLEKNREKFLQLARSLE